MDPQELINLIHDSEKIISETDKGRDITPVFRYLVSLKDAQRSSESYKDDPVKFAEAMGFKDSLYFPLLIYGSNVMGDYFGINITGVSGSCTEDKESAENLAALVREMFDLDEVSKVGVREVNIDGSIEKFTAQDDGYTVGIILRSW